MSKQDTHFINTFSMVIGLLVTVAILILVFARMVGARTQVQDVYADPSYQADVNKRIRPLAQVAVVGQNNAGMEIKGLAVEGAVALAVPKDGTELFESVCKTCHGAGLVGAPKLTDKANWAPRLAQGTATLYKHALEGYTGKAGSMPKKGGRVDLTDDLIKAGVDYMVSQAK